MMKAFTLALALTGLASTAVAADSYVGGGLTFTNLDAGDGVEFDVNNLELTVGSTLNSYLAVEARLSAGVADDDYSEGPITIEAQARLGLALYLKPQIGIGEQFTIYGLAGYTSQEYEIDVSSPLGDSMEREHLKGAAYGLGASYHANDNLTLNIEYNRYEADAAVGGSEFDIDVENIIVSASHRF